MWGQMHVHVWELEWGSFASTLRGLVLCACMCACVVRSQVRHRNLSIYNRLLSLLKDASRRFFLFSNEHNKDT